MWYVLKVHDSIGSFYSVGPEMPQARADARVHVVAQLPIREALALHGVLEARRTPRRRRRRSPDANALRRPVARA
jgi:hypothetical protein